MSSCHATQGGVAYCRSRRRHHGTDQTKSSGKNKSQFSSARGRIRKALNEVRIGISAQKKRTCFCCCCCCCTWHRFYKPAQGQSVRGARVAPLPYLSWCWYARPRREMVVMGEVRFLHGSIYIHAYMKASPTIKTAVITVSGVRHGEHPHPIPYPKNSYQYCLGARFSFDSSGAVAPRPGT